MVTGRGKKMLEYSEKHGVEMKRTIRYTTQQNGVAERMTRTIIEKAFAKLTT